MNLQNHQNTVVTFVIPQVVIDMNPALNRHISFVSLDREITA